MGMWEALAEARAAIRARCTLRPRVGLMLGSGLDGLAQGVEAEEAFPYAQIPHFPPTTACGHRGELVLGKLEGVEVAVLRGRAHFYEGRSMAEIAFPVRVLKDLGAGYLIVTNASGGVNPALAPGDIMLIVDHINLPGLAGHTPIQGPHFVDMSQAYDPELGEMAARVAQSLGFTLQHGVYAMVAGPSYETPAEVRFLRTIGADAVGMSTVPEVLAAREVEMRVLGLSHITNRAGTPSRHDEVLAAGEAIAPRFAVLIRGLLREMRASFEELA